MVLSLFPKIPKNSTLHYYIKESKLLELITNFIKHKQGWARQSRNQPTKKSAKDTSR